MRRTSCMKNVRRGAGISVAAGGERVVVMGAVGGAGGVVVRAVAARGELDREIAASSRRR
ncbi:hypothetical protein QJS10_CPB20g00872 [Acorus calamus]|uniref:Uncharacterized protein n=1 Tax=Acorus calamus TaxID=4465 RepID=A0AAV9CBR4_ACOCL|nr:hypothetical protein QJS10_CPB20g00872 [Acorus calamus]